MAPTQEFPYQDGDVTVLGPEIFASKDGAVISWRGENYTRQEFHELEVREDLTPDAIYELASSVRDLASSLRLERADRRGVKDRFLPPAAEGLPLEALESATNGATALDAFAETPNGRNFLAHALVQLARDGWLRRHPDLEAAFDAAEERPAHPIPEPQEAP